MRTWLEYDLVALAALVLGVAVRVHYRRLTPVMLHDAYALDDANHIGVGEA